jgi:hypothetical protein
MSNCGAWTVVLDERKSRQSKTALSSEMDEIVQHAIAVALFVCLLNDAFALIFRWKSQPHLVRADQTTVNDE